MDADLRARYDDEVRWSLRPPPGRRRQDDGAVVRIVGPTPHALDNMVCASRLSSATADAAIDAVVSEAHRSGRDVQWNVYGHDEPVDLVERLRRRGFVAGAEEAVMILPSSASSLVAPVGPDVSVRRVADERDLSDAIAVQEAVWGNDHTQWLLDWWRPALRGEGDPIAIFLASVGGEPAGIGWVVLSPGATFAPLFGGTVLPRFRKRGIHRRIVALRAREAWEAGIPWLVVDANPQSAPLLARLAFEPVLSRTEMVLRTSPERSVTSAISGGGPTVDPVS